MSPVVFVSLPLLGAESVILSRVVVILCVCVHFRESLLAQSFMNCFEEFYQIYHFGALADKCELVGF